VALHPAAQLVIHPLGIEGYTGGKALDDDDEGLPV
jgi:hypothetical protein